jgi:hypothetical protein
MQTEASQVVNAPIFLRRHPGLHDVDLAGTFALRQGLWIEDLRTPPEQECSNGSLILLAVVLWRTFLQRLNPNMKLLKVKTARFSQVVEKSGKPEVYTLWQKPGADRHFQSQLKNNRVMTILKSESGTDFGVVGFKERKSATYLVFPKSLKRFADERIVGINWAFLSR